MQVLFRTDVSSYSSENYHFDAFKNHLGKHFVIYHIYQGTAYAKCVILMFYSAFRDDCLVVNFFSGICSFGVNFCLHFSGEDRGDRG